MERAGSPRFVPAAAPRFNAEVLGATSASALPPRSCSRATWFGASAALSIPQAPRNFPTR
eukprot:8132835-Lingulodinium_polyedra.AAC.1